MRTLGRNQETGPVWSVVLRYVRFYVDKRHNFGHHGANTAELFLSCGHTKFQKGSKPIPRRAQCHDCTLIAHGGVIEVGEHG